MSRQPIQVLVYLARPAGDRWEYLLLHRVPRLGSFWQGVTGGVKDGEELAEAARREVFEETGLTSTKFEQIDFSYAFPVKDEWLHLYSPEPNEIVEYVFLARVDDGNPMLSWEHDAWRWSTYEEALDLLKWPGNIEALKRCERLLKSRS